MTCQDDQMCSRLKARIDGVIPRVQAIWGKTSSMEEWVFLLVDAKNADGPTLMAVRSSFCLQLSSFLVIASFEEQEWDGQYST